MTTALAPRRMLLGLLIAVAALLFIGAGPALAAQCGSLSDGATAVHHSPVAYADGTLTVARHGARRARSTHATVRSMTVANRKPVAYADGTLTVARHGARRHHHHRRLLTHTA